MIIPNISVKIVNNANENYKNLRLFAIQNIFKQPNIYYQKMKLALETRLANLLFSILPTFLTYRIIFSTDFIIFQIFLTFFVPFIIPDYLPSNSDKKIWNTCKVSIRVCRFVLVRFRSCTCSNDLIKNFQKKGKKR